MFMWMGLREVVSGRCGDVEAVKWVTPVVTGPNPAPAVCRNRGKIQNPKVQVVHIVHEKTQSCKCIIFLYLTTAAIRIWIVENVYNRCLLLGNCMCLPPVLPCFPCCWMFGRHGDRKLKNHSVEERVMSSQLRAERPGILMSFPFTFSQTIIVIHRFSAKENKGPGCRTVNL